MASSDPHVVPLFLIHNRYWNDKDVLQKLGEAMGLAVTGEAATSAEPSVPDESEEGGNDEDESVVHQTASIGDVEVKIIIFLCYLNLSTYVGHWVYVYKC